MAKLKVWFMAHFLDYPFWRVEYSDYERTQPLYYAEAKGLKDVFNGKMFIDYDYGKTYLKP